MALANGLGVNPPPMPSPLARIVDRQPGQPNGLTVERYEIDIETAWFLFLEKLYTAVQNGTGGSSTFPQTPYAVVTPANTITPQLELISWDGTLSILLNRATTTINAATLSGLTPYDGFKFQIIFTNDATDGRMVVFDAAYKNCATPSGGANLKDLYHFTAQGGLFLCDYQAQSIVV